MKVVETSLEATNVKSLLWMGDSLCDWIGGKVYAADGSHRGIGVHFAYRFDSVKSSPSGRFVALYERLGTKGIVWDYKEQKITRELNRSFYQANAFDYPIALFSLADGRELIAHCPENYNVIEIDDLVTNEHLTQRNNNARDFFHSRLSLSPKSTHLMSAGWAWSPFSTIVIFSIDAVLQTPQLLDETKTLQQHNWDSEISSSVWLDEKRLVLYSEPDADDLGEDEEYLGPRMTADTLAIYDLESKTYQSTTRPQAYVGTMHVLDDGHVLELYDHPKIIRLSDGTVTESWPLLHSGKQLSSIYREKLPPMAFDNAKKRFAVADEAKITILSFET